MPNDYPIIECKTQEEFAKWLAKNHTTVPGVWIRMFKKATAIPTVTHDQALDEALCYGWIDGQVKSYDEKSWIQKFTPRRPRSTWSKRNIEHIERLTKLGKMQPEGLAEVEKAKADGRWAAAYDSPSTMTIPEDFLKALTNNKKAKETFETLNKSNTYAIAWRIQTAKKPETKERRIKTIIEMLEKGEKLY